VVLEGQLALKKKVEVEREAQECYCEGKKEKELTKLKRLRHRLLH
jgi:hypothetical protein